ncbi:MAG: LamG domain-containing protein [Verrucomicrobia bacterium]|nr:LamG domain-containing protein [Verrucomicrobiota bacterium]
MLTTTKQTQGTKYTLTVNNVKDLFGNVIAANTKVSFLPATVASGLAAYWNLDGNLRDSVNGFHGTARGTAPLAYVAGKPGLGQALKLDGTDQFVEITEGDSANNLAFAGGSVSIAGWFKVATFDTSWQCLIARGEGSSWRVARNSASGSMSYAGGLTDVTGATDVTDGAWHHFVAITDQTAEEFGTALYIDGLLDGTQNVMIGENPDARGREWNGELDELAVWNRVLTTDEIAILYANGAGKPLSDFLPPPINLADGLKAYWNFDGHLYDAVKDFHGTGRGTQPPAYVDGKAGFGKAIKLDGSNQFVEITGGNENELEFPGGSMSIAGWFKVDAFDTSWQCLLSKGEGENYRVARRGDGNAIAYAGGVGEGADDVPPVNDGQWHHFVAVSDATGAAFGTALYVDGVRRSVNATKPVLASSSFNLMIGENPGARGREWKGEVDDIAIWNRVLSEAEVAALYNAGTGTPLGTLANLAGPIVISLTRSGGNVVIAWTPAGGTLEFTPTLGPTASWTVVGTANPATIAVAAAGGYYRVRK